MKLLNDKADFIATLTYRTSEQGGRTTPVFNTGYRPQVKFAFSDMQTSGQQTFIDKDVVYPGDSVTAEIQIIAVEFFANQLTEGMGFEFREGSRVIGDGTISKILNERLKKASR
jgi:translation elongation factor EF-Tu-like GTPase